MSNAEPVVQVDRVSFRYPGSPTGQPTLEDVSLEIHPHDFLGIVGPNGGGKTTLLRLILGLLEPQAGTVRVFGKSPSRVCRQIGYVPQLATVDLQAPATVLDVVLEGRLGLSPWGVFYKRQHVEAARQALSRTRVLDLAEAGIGELSGGQRQRVLIARALASDARMLLLDEPTTGVDIHMEKGLVALLEELNEQMPIVMVSHDVGFVLEKMNRVACVNRTLRMHDSQSVTAAGLADSYHTPVRMVDHSHDVADHEHSHHHAHHAPTTSSHEEGQSQS